MLNINGFLVGIKENNVIRLIHLFNAIYNSETCRYLKIRVREHLGVSPLTGRKAKAKTITAIKDDLLFCDHAVSLEEFKILVSSNSENLTLRSKNVC